MPYSGTVISTAVSLNSPLRAAVVGASFSAPAAVTAAVTAARHAAYVAGREAVEPGAELTWDVERTRMYMDGGISYQPF